MRNLKLILLTVALFSGVMISNAQRTTVRVYPKHGTVVTKISKPTRIVYRNSKYHFSDGVWYKARGRNFVVCAAPAGVKVRRLPRGRKAVVMNGRKLYKYKGIWYKKSGRNYVVVTV